MNIVIIYNINNNIKLSIINKNTKIELFLNKFCPTFFSCLEGIALYKL